MWRCKPCRKENPDSTRTCRRCGTRRKAERLSDAVGEIPDPPPAPAPPPAAAAAPEPASPTAMAFVETVPGPFPRATHVVRESQIVSASTLALTATALAAMTGAAGGR